MGLRQRQQPPGRDEFCMAVRGLEETESGRVSGVRKCQSIKLREPSILMSTDCMIDFN